MKGERPEKDLGWLRQISSFASARVILTANHFRIFDHLEGRGKTAIAVSKVLASDGRATEVLLNSLMDADVKGALDSLPEAFRNVVVLADIEGFSYKEIADILSIPIGTVMSRLHRGRRQLQVKLWDYARRAHYVRGESGPSKAAGGSR